MSPRVQFAIDLLVLLLIVGTGAAGALQLPAEFGVPSTPWQRLVPWCELAYVLGAAGVLIGWRRRASWVLPSAVLWSVGCIGAGSIATGAYGGGSASAVALAGIGTLVLTGAATWWIHRRMAERAG